MTWYNKYVGLPFKHLGDDPEEGLDCFNLCRYVYKQELNIHMTKATYDFCNIADEHWYNKTNQPLLIHGAECKDPSFSWKKVSQPEPFDVIIMSIGSTNIPNHTALYVDVDKILQIMVDRRSWVGPYGKHYKRYTHGIYRWNGLKN